MRLLVLLTTSELENKILNEVLKIEDICDISGIIFDENISNGRDGTYIFANSQGYHYVQLERGSEEVHKVTDDVFEICFWCLYELTSKAAFDYEFAHRGDGKLNYRKVAFAKQLDYLYQVDENFKKRGEIEIDENLKVNPL